MLRNKTLHYENDRTTLSHACRILHILPSSMIPFILILSRPTSWMSKQTKGQTLILFDLSSEAFPVKIITFCLKAVHFMNRSRNKSICVCGGRDLPRFQQRIVRNPSRQSVNASRSSSDIKARSKPATAAGQS